MRGKECIHIYTYVLKRNNHKSVLMDTRYIQQLYLVHQAYSTMLVKVGIQTGNVWLRVMAQTKKIQSLSVTYNGCIQFEYTRCQIIPSFFLCIVCRGTSRIFCSRLFGFFEVLQVAIQYHKHGLQRWRSVGPYYSFHQHLQTCLY